jgi:hypothetical protein
MCWRTATAVVVVRPNVPVQSESEVMDCSGAVVLEAVATVEAFGQADVVQKARDIEQFAVVANRVQRGECTTPDVRTKRMVGEKWGTGSAAHVLRFPRRAGVRQVDSRQLVVIEAAPLTTSVALIGRDRSRAELGMPLAGKENPPERDDVDPSWPPSRAATRLATGSRDRCASRSVSPGR